MHDPATRQPAASTSSLDDVVVSDHQARSADRLPVSQRLLANLEQLRTAQRSWAERHWSERLKLVGTVAGEIARQAEALAQSVYRPAASVGEVMASEVLPVAEACRYLARRGGQVMRPRTLPSSDNPWWMGRIVVEQIPQALGVVLVIGPSNYPLFLNAVPMIQALAAGNAVLVKPAPGCETVMHQFKGVLSAVGIPGDLVEVLDGSPQSAMQLIDHGVDKVIFTGSYQNGRTVAQHVAQRMVPGTFELSGCDAVIILEDADQQLVAKSVAYALSLNGGQTCIAPRRLLATPAMLQQLVPLLNEQMSTAPKRTITARGQQLATRAVAASINAGARVVIGDFEQFSSAESVGPLVLKDVTADMPVAREDIFAPVLSLMAAENLEHAIELANRCPYALGATVFGNRQSARQVASRLTAPSVAINDVLVPTADPRVSFGGRAASGYGLTRGLEGLRQMTSLKVVSQRRGRWLPHLSTPRAQLAGMLHGIILLRHGPSWSDKWAGLRKLIRRK